MKPKYALSILGLSLVAAIALAVQLIRHQHQRHSLVIATGGQNGEYYAFAQALSSVVARRHPEIQIRVLETAGASENLELLETRRADLAIVQSDTPAKPSERAVAYLFPELFHLIARLDSGIKTVADLKGKRVALMPKGSGSYGLFWSLGQHYNLQPSDLKVLPLPPDQAYAALRAGQVDALFRVIALGNPATSKLLQDSRSQLIAIDQVGALRLSRPYLEGAIIPKGTYDGSLPLPAQDLPVVGVRAVLVANEAVNAEVIKEITQTLFDYRNEIVAQYPRAASIRLPEAGENLGLPMHPGARSYYSQDTPNFFVQYADAIALLLSIVVVCVSGLWQFRHWLAENQKNRADLYNLEILSLIDQIQAVESLEQLESARTQLFEIFRKVVVDLDTDQITPESFQSFTFTWEVGLDMLRHRETILINLAGNLTGQ